MLPALVRKVSNPSVRHDDPLGEQQHALGEEIPPEAAELAARGDHAMAGDGRIAGGTHDVADRAVRAGRPCGGGHVAIRGDSPMRNAADD